MVFFLIYYGKKWCYVWRMKVLKFFDIGSELFIVVVDIIRIIYVL